MFSFSRLILCASIFCLTSAMYSMTENQRSSPKKRKHNLELKQDDGAAEPHQKKAFIAGEKAANKDPINGPKSPVYAFPTFGSLMDGEDASENQSDSSNNQQQAIQSSDDNNEDEITQTSPSRSTPQTSSSPQRTPTTRGIFMRNPEKLKKLTPNSKDKAIKEAAVLTPFFIKMYNSQYATRDPQNITPLHSQKTRKKQKTSAAAQLTSEDVIKMFSDADIPASWFGNVETFAEKGYTVYQADQLIDLNKRDPENRTNAERMHKGNAPIGPGGEINLHHLTRQDPGPIIEISGYTHRRESGVVHASTGSVGSERQSFDAFRSWYWRQRIKKMEKPLSTTKNTKENQKESKLNELDSLIDGIGKITTQIFKDFEPKESSEETQSIITEIASAIHNLSTESFNLEDLVTRIMQLAWDRHMQNAIDTDLQADAREAFKEKLITLLNEESLKKILISTGILLIVEQKQQAAKAQGSAENMSLPSSVHTPSLTILKATSERGCKCEEAYISDTRAS